jgi:cysteine/O-acetylserine efflux protein
MASTILYTIIMTFTPGPNNIMSMNNARNVGFKKGIKFNFGILVGSFFVMVLCLWFSFFLYKVVTKVQFPMKILGAIYMVYLIIKTIVPSKENKIRDNNGSFIIGALLQLINPKVIFFGIMIMSSYILPHYQEILTLILFVFFITIIGFIATVCWALFGSLFNVLFYKHKKIIDIIMVILLLYCAISLFL